MPLSYSLDLTRLSAAYQSHQLTPSIVVRDVLAQVDDSSRTNPAWIYVMPREALVGPARGQARLLPHILISIALAAIANFAP